MIKAKSKNKDVLGIQYFYQLFVNRKRLFPAVYFLYPIDTRKKNVEVPRELHKALIKTYLNIYFNEFYYQDIPKYFPLSGILRKAKGANCYFRKEGLPVISRGIIWLWYNRPSFAYISNVVLKKMKGAGNILDLLEKQYKIDKEVEFLPNSRELSRKLLQTNKLFKT